MNTGGKVESEVNADDHGKEPDGQAPKETPTEPEKKEPAKKPEPSFNPEVENWLKSKGIETKSVDPVALKLAEMARNSESQMSKTINELEALKKESLTKSAETVLEEPKSDPRPSEAVDQKFQKAIDSLCALNDCESEDEFEVKFPDAYRKIRNQWDRELWAAYKEDVKREFEGHKKAGEKEAEQKRLEKEYETVKSFYKGNIDEAKKADPEIETKLDSSGVKNFVGKLGELTGVPVEYILADQDFFKFAAIAADAIQFKSNIEKHKEAWKQEYEADLVKVKEAELPGDQPISEDSKALLARLAQKRSAGY
jgi:Asp-tRNA(Asn)/Glu-tRNA(Gln) amidotransferase A subunit family amidase